MTDAGSLDGPRGVRVREASPRERPDVLNVLDGAVLATDAGRIRRASDRGDVLVAVAGEDEESDNPGDGRVLGALVLDGEEITAVAVRRRRRDQGVGTALVEAAARRRDRLVAEFDPRARSFWESLGFTVSGIPDSRRYRGVRPEPDPD